MIDHIVFIELFDHVCSILLPFLEQAVQINQYVTRVEREVCSVSCVPDRVSALYFKLPYIGHYSGVTQKRIRHLIKRYCNNIDIKLIFSSFKIGNLFSAKDPIPSNLRLSVACKFSCVGCNAGRVGETTRHFSTRVRGHLATDRASHVYKHLQQSESCRNLCSIGELLQYFRLRHYKLSIKDQRILTYPLGKAHVKSTG